MAFPFAAKHRKRGGREEEGKEEDEERNRKRGRKEEGREEGHEKRAKRVRVRGIKMTAKGNLRKNFLTQVNVRK